ncbi:uncharacterized protein QC764_703100 [Podospora pseudoanserina]|uniref:Protein kinase domain-containing protein n=1 Tax=Podospora pseudoanserina TaxID=2609844 RepID=A0ABR0HIU8_9PEZI|nr:hypothetical protein QC764_703100 [Podospora pseudoanserina]
MPDNDDTPPLPEDNNDSPPMSEDNDNTSLIPEEDDPLEATEYDARSSQRDSPHYIAMRGEAPSVFVNGVASPLDYDRAANNQGPLKGGRRSENPSSLRRSNSNASSARSEITVWDLGEELCDACHRDTLGEREEIPIASPTSTSPALMVRLWSLRRPKDSPDHKLPQFFPWRSVEKLITPQEVIRALQGARSGLAVERIERYADQICRPHKCADDRVSNSGFRKIFAILVKISCAVDITHFVDRGICDGDLPLTAVPVDEGQMEMRLQGQENKKLDFLRHWDDELKHDDFEKLQWTMLVPYFAKRPGHSARLYVLPKKVVLPWLSEERRYDGGYSWVSKVMIHPHHHNFNQLEDHLVSSNLFAVKHLKAHLTDDASNTDLFPPANGTPGVANLQVVVSEATVFSQSEIKTEFEQEIEILNRLSRRPHPHLITLLAAYQVGDECCMIFPWADCDLKSMWQISPDPGDPLEKVKLKWVLDQCLGLAQGLNQIHHSRPTPTLSESKMLQRVYGRHGDIKPENILFFRDKTKPDDKGRLVITDFGLTRYHGNDTKTYLRDMKPPATPTYRPPECDIITSPISQSFDIWSFGCVLLEFIAWHLGGWPLVEQFVKKRKLQNPLMNNWQTDQFFEILQDNPNYGSTGTVVVRVKQEIHEFVSELHSHPSCSDTIHHLLDFIMSEMIVVELKRKRTGTTHDSSMSKQDHTRASCGNVVKKLKSLCAQLDQLPDMLTATPYSAKIRPSIVVEMKGYPVGGRYTELPVNRGTTVRATDRPEHGLGHPETW